jgi:hypothetical protein
MSLADQRSDQAARARTFQPGHRRVQPLPDPKSAAIQLRIKVNPRKSVSRLERAFGPDRCCGELSMIQPPAKEVVACGQHAFAPGRIHPTIHAARRHSARAPCARRQGKMSFAAVQRSIGHGVHVDVCLGQPGAIGARQVGQPHGADQPGPRRRNGQPPI